MTVDTAFKTSKDLGYSALAITEHNNLSSVFHALKASTQYDLKYIPGIEFNFRDSEEDSNSRQLVIIASNESGFKSLLRVAYLSFCRDVNNPHIIWEDLADLDVDGVYVLSGGAEGHLAVKTLLYGPRVGLEIADKFLMVFKDRFFIETNVPFDDKQKEINMILKDLSEKKGIKRVLALDSHFASEDDRYLFNIFLAIQNKGSIYEKDALFYYRPPLLSPKEVVRMAEELEGDVKMSEEIASLCCDPRQYLQAPDNFMMPAFDVPSTYNYKEFLEWREKQKTL
jgi:DNA polymerase-3 subunit alpha